jgi:hypothetical protein
MYAPYCPRCGAPFSVVCANCGTPNTQWAIRCVNCNWFLKKVCPTDGVPYDPMVMVCARNHPITPWCKKCGKVDNTKHVNDPCTTAGCNNRPMES